MHKCPGKVGTWRKVEEGIEGEENSKIKMMRVKK
jgi:hypothetical protein